MPMINHLIRSGPSSSAISLHLHHHAHIYPSCPYPPTLLIIRQLVRLIHPPIPFPLIPRPSIRSRLDPKRDEKGPIRTVSIKRGKRRETEEEEKKNSAQSIQDPTAEREKTKIQRNRRPDQEENSRRKKKEQKKRTKKKNKKEQKKKNKNSLPALRPKVQESDLQVPLPTQIVSILERPLTSLDRFESIILVVVPFDRGFGPSELKDMPRRHDGHCDPER